jgi:hypothetical protein
MTAFTSIPGAIDLRSSSLRVQALLKENAIERVFGAPFEMTTTPVTSSFNFAELARVGVPSAVATVARLPLLGTFVQFNAFGTWVRRPSGCGQAVTLATSFLLRGGSGTGSVEMKRTASWSCVGNTLVLDVL